MHRIAYFLLAFVVSDAESVAQQSATPVHVANGATDAKIALDLVTVLGEDIGRLWGLPLKRGTLTILRATVCNELNKPAGNPESPSTNAGLSNERVKRISAQIDSVDQNTNDEFAKLVNVREFRSEWARGKVLAVDQFADRYDVRISVGADAGIVVGLRANVFIGPELATPKPGHFPVNYVASGQIVDVGPDRATCNIGPSLESKANGVPEQGDDVLVRIKRTPATFVVAKHVVVHDGKIIRWDEVRNRLAELNEQGLIEPTIRFTKSMKDEREQRSEDFGNWCEETTGSRFNSGTLSDPIG